MGLVENILSNLSWSSFKSLVDDKAMGIQYIDVEGYYFLKAFDSSFSIGCAMLKDGGADQIDFEDNYKAAGNVKLKQEVETQNEKNDKVLKLACATANFAANACVVSIKVPGTPGGTDGRWAAGGYCFTDAWVMGVSKVDKVQVVDTDDLLGYGAGTVVKEYYDSDMAAGSQGWFMYPAQQNSGEIEIDPIGGYGFIPSGFYLEIHATCTSSTKMCVDIWWAKEE